MFNLNPCLYSEQKADKEATAADGADCQQRAVTLHVSPGLFHLITMQQIMDHKFVDL